MVPRGTFRFAALTLACALATTRSEGAIVGVGDGAANTTAPLDTPAFDNVARFRVGSAVYLGDRWLLTAGHVYGGIDTDPVTFSDGGTQYFMEGSGIQLSYPREAGVLTDLTLIRISTDPGLPQIQFGATPAVGTSIVMAGYGRNRADDLTRWDSGTKPWTDVTNGGDRASDKVGYKYAQGTAKRWATNLTSALDDEGSPTIEYDTEAWYTGKVTLFGAEFTRSGDTRTPSEGIVANGDSGGGVFANNRLIGMPLYLGLFEDQPDETAVYGNYSYFANLAGYVDQIATITGLHPSTDGDANLDGVVNATDFDILVENFGDGPGAGWTRGDFNLDGQITFGDFQLLERNFIGTLPVDAQQRLSPVMAPEPASLTLLLMAVPLLGRPRRSLQRR